MLAQRDRKGSLPAWIVTTVATTAIGFVVWTAQSITGLQVDASSSKVEAGALSSKIDDVKATVSSVEQDVKGSATKDDVKRLEDSIELLNRKMDGALESLRRIPSY